MSHSDAFRFRITYVEQGPFEKAACVCACASQAGCFTAHIRTLGQTRVLVSKVKGEPSFDKPNEEARGVVLLDNGTVNAGF